MTKMMKIEIVTFAFKLVNVCLIRCIVAKLWALLFYAVVHFGTGLKLQTNLGGHNFF